MATNVSQIFHDLKTYVSEKWEQLVAYFANRKVTKLEDAEKKLPDLFAEPSTPPRPLSSRTPKVSKNVTPVVNPPEPSMVRQKSDEKQLLSEYNPGGTIFQQALRRANISTSRLDTNTLANYADAVSSHFPLNPEDDLEQILETELFYLIQAIKTGKPHSPKPPSKPVFTPPKPSREPEPVVVRSKRENWVTFDDEQKPPITSSSQDKRVDVKSQTSIQTSQPKVVEKKQLAIGQVEYHPFDRELPASTAGINWLHLNRYYNRVDFDEVADEMIRQSGEAVKQYAGKARHVANTMHLYCKNKDWKGMMAYAHNMRNNQVVPFDPVIMGEVHIRLFQDSLIRALEFKMSRHPDRAETYQEAIHLASIADWNSLATSFMLHTERYGPDYVPTYCFEQLERVIPEYEVPRPKLPKIPETFTDSVPSVYVSPVSDFKTFGKDIPPSISVAALATRLTHPGVLGNDGRSALRRVEYGMKNNDFYSVAEGMTYLAEDQRQPITDPATYRAVRFRMIKERAMAELSETISRENDPQMKEQLLDALHMVEHNQWSRLADYDLAYHKHSDNGLFGSYLLREMGQYNRLPKS